MESEQLLFTNGETTDITTQLPDITSAVTDMLIPFILLSLVISIVFITLYITAMIRRRKLENAILDMQKTLHEMNERDKARSRPSVPIPQPRTSNEKIAAEPSNSDAAA